MAAEDALSEALYEALRVWPASGVPDNPDAWLLTVARNRERDRFKSSAFRLAAPLRTAEEQLGLSDEIDLERIPDQRLRLLFVCAHPSIDIGIRTPLMLQTVLGQDAKSIARAYAVAPGAMAQRLVRAKHKIRGAAIPFVIPGTTDIPERLEAVLEAIYGVYALDWDSDVERDIVDDFSREALYLARELTALLPRQAEVFGLAALMAFSLSRRAARRSPDGAFIPLDAQDTA
jgi:RNA polymerase sigma-70 factor (ECF subfamily)